MSFQENAIKYGGVYPLAINSIASGYGAQNRNNFGLVAQNSSQLIYLDRTQPIYPYNTLTDCYVIGNEKNNKYIHFYLNMDGDVVKSVGCVLSNSKDSFSTNVQHIGYRDIIEIFTAQPITKTNTSLLTVGIFKTLYTETSQNVVQTVYSIVVFSQNIGDNRIEYQGIAISDDVLELEMGASIDSSLSSPIYGDASNSGGYGGGSFDDSSDIIPIPNKPTLGVSSTGFVNVYHTSLNALQNLGSELFPDIEDIITPPMGTEVADVLKETLFGINQSVSRIGSLITNSKLIDYIVDCHLLPVTPDSGQSEKIKIGFKQFEVQGNKVLNDYIDFDCGSLSIAEYYQNFIDYVGTRAKLYLPFVGFVPIPNEYFQGGKLSVKYRFNVIDGSFMAYVLSTSSKSQLADTVIGSYGGNACVHIPITGSNYANMVSGLLNGTMGTLANAMGGNAVGTVSSALSVMSNRPDVQSSNGYNSTSAFLGVRRPYLIIEREVSNFSQTYTEEKGLPCNISKEIGSLSGFVRMDNIHMETLTCTDTEKEMIRQLLEEGVIV